ncbi:hypothetical protein [Vannielia litorea]|uniref:hypothetical protein n=1 Tax=Vannielia litorea TaxID=1217970 RepID=UPI001BCC11E0|nr:hypothetical protein [Vannielia litorea]MBS8228160.1 hypothetical protein [Vannielia litorea]
MPGQSQHSKRPGLIDRLKERHRLAQVVRKTFRKLAPLGPVPEVDAAAVGGPAGACELTIRREGRGFRLLLPNFRAHRHSRTCINRNAPTYLWWMIQAGPEVTESAGNYSDGDLPSLARFSFSSCGAAIPVPDFHFFRDRGYAEMRRVAEETALPWEARSTEVVWRGGPNGYGSLSTDPALAGNPRLLQRMALVQRCKGTPIEARFAPLGDNKHAQVMEAEGLVGDVLPNASWGGRKLALDIDGFTNAWGNLFHRLLLGCCVLKVESGLSYRQWYYGDMEPGRHFIPLCGPT